MYYEQLIKALSENSAYEQCVANIINPFSLYYLCNHYYGTEAKQHNIPIPSDKTDLLTNNNLSAIKDFDIIHCQVNYFNKFCNEVLDKIDKKFILTTGQWYLPQIHKSQLTEKIRNNKNIVLWVSQNPIYENSANYIAFPYGIEHLSIKCYADILLKGLSAPKMKELINLPMKNRTNPCRAKLPVLPGLPVHEFYTQLAEGKFILSPIGDRDDCYRHYEAIGLGTMPISNVHSFYRTIFTTNMIYASIEDMVAMLADKSFHLTYEEPNKDLICFEYYKNLVQKHIDDFKGGCRPLSND